MLLENILVLWSGLAFWGSSSWGKNWTIFCFLYNGCHENFLCVIQKGTAGRLDFSRVYTYGEFNSRASSETLMQLSFFLLLAELYFHFRSTCNFEGGVQPTVTRVLVLWFFMAVTLWIIPDLCFFGAVQIISLTSILQEWKVLFSNIHCGHVTSWMKTWPHSSHVLEEQWHASTLSLASYLTAMICNCRQPVRHEEKVTFIGIIFCSLEMLHFLGCRLVASTAPIHADCTSAYSCTRTVHIFERRKVKLCHEPNNIGSMIVYYVPSLSHW